MQTSQGFWKVMHIQATPLTSHLNRFTSVSGVAHINHKICSNLGKFMKVTKLYNYKFAGQQKNQLAYSVLATCIFKLQKNGRVTCHRWVSKVTPADKPDRRPHHHKWAGWVVCRANSAACFQLEAQTQEQKLAGVLEI